MAEIIRMPRLSDTMEEGNIVAWLKKVGDKVSPGDILAEVETDKATMELESFHDGYLLYISVEKGPVPVNDILAVIGKQDEDYKSLLSSADGNGQTSLKKDEVADDTKPDSKTEESKTEESKTEESKTEESKKETKAKESGSASAETKTKEPVTESAVPEKSSTEEPQSKRIKSSPLAKSIAAEAGIDLTGLKGTGDGGRIVKRDVENVVSSGHTKDAKKSTPDTTVQFGEVPLSQMRKTIAKRLVESKFSAPHFYLTIKVNMDKVAESRKQINESAGLKISFNDFIVKACAVALKSHPAINSSWLGDKIRVNKDINIGIAVAVDEGLLVPVLFGAGQLGLNEINTTISQLADKARQKKLQPQEMQGNTFTISNLGMMGIDEFTAIINPPDAAILAVGAINEEIIMVNKEVSSVKFMKVTLSCDHRVIDGATGARFLQSFKHLLENPVAMLI